MDESEVDDFFDGVAGKPSEAQPPRTSHRLGATVRAAVLRQRASGDDALSAEQALERDALLDSLDKRGLFDDPQTSVVDLPRRRRSTGSAFARWSRPLALAAALAICAVGIRQVWPVLQGGPDVAERGSGELTLQSVDPAGTQRELAQELTAAGAQVQAVQINDSTWTLSVDVPRTADGAVDTDARDRIRSILAKRGINAPNADSLSLVVESAAH
jgi:hypothetical protein